MTGNPALMWTVLGWALTILITGLAAVFLFALVFLVAGGIIAAVKTLKEPHPKKTLSASHTAFDEGTYPDEGTYHPDAADKWLDRVEESRFFKGFDRLH